jgi:hypothetical protein
VLKAERTRLNQSITGADADKLSASRSVGYLEESAARADIGKALQLLNRAGDEPPREGDEIASDLEEVR